MVTKKKAKKRKKPSSRPAASKKPKKSKKKVPTKPAKKMSAPKKKPNTAAKKRAAPKPAKTQTAVPSPKTFAEKIRDRDPATEVWYRVGDVLSHGVTLGPGAAGNVMVVSNGVVSGVPAEDLFETQADAAAR